MSPASIFIEIIRITSGGGTLQSAEQSKDATAATQESKASLNLRNLGN